MKLSQENKADLWQAWGSEETLGSLAHKLSTVHRVCNSYTSFSINYYIQILVAVDDRAKLLTQTDLVKYIVEHDQHNPVLEETVSSVVAKHGWKIADEVRFIQLLY